MRNNNKKALNISSLLTGVSSAFCLVSGYQQNLLYPNGPGYILLAFALSSLFFSFYNSLKVINHVKFIVYSAATLLIYSTFLYLLNTGMFPEITTNIIWLSSGFFIHCYCSWIIPQLYMRYIHPETSKNIFGKPTLYYEAGLLAGTIFSVLLFNYYAFRNFTVYGDMIKVSAYFFILSAGVQISFFLDKNNFEINHVLSEINDPNKEKHSKLLKMVLPDFFLLCMGIGSMLALSFNYLNDVLFDAVKTYNSNFVEKVRTFSDILGAVFVLTCLLVLGLSHLYNKKVVKKKFSPYELYSIFLKISIIILAPTIFFKNAYYAVFCVSIVFALFKVLIGSGNFLWINFISPDYQRKFQKIKSFGQLVLPFLLLWLIQGFYKLDYIIPLGFAIFAFFSIKNLASKHCSYLKSLLDSNDPIEVLVASDGLGYLKPNNLRDLFAEHLKTAKDDHIKSTLISGLSAVDTESDFETIKNEFFNGTFIVQMSILDSFTQRPTNQKVEFLIDLIVNKEYQNLTKIRSFAAKNLGKIYGKRIVPILLWEVKHDPRVQANILEVLADLKDSTLDSLFINFIKNKIPRLKAIGILGLYNNHPRNNVTVRAEIDWMLEQEDDPAMIASALYVIGRAKLHKYEQEIVALTKNPSKKEIAENPRVERTIAYALSSYGNEQGITLFSKYFSIPFEVDSSNEFMHFFTQLESDTRFEILRHFIKFYGSKDGQLENASKYLKYASIDLHSEIQFLSKAHAI